MNIDLLKLDTDGIVWTSPACIHGEGDLVSVQHRVHLAFHLTSELMKTKISTFCIEFRHDSGFLSAGALNLDLV